MIWVLAFLVLFFYLLWQTFNNSSQGFGLVVWKGEDRDKKIALTFDDGPNPESTEKLLNIFRKYNVKATFFVLGKNVVSDPELLKKIDKAGHEIETHGFCHSGWLFLKPPSRIKQDLERAKSTVATYTGKNPRFFRPPYTRKSPWLLSEAKKLNLTTLTWSIDSADYWLKPVKQRIIKRVVSQIHNGSIILFHEGDNKKPMLEALPKIIEFAKNRGFQFVRLDELVKAS